MGTSASCDVDAVIGHGDRAVIHVVCRLEGPLCSFNKRYISELIIIINIGRPGILS